MARNRKTRAQKIKAPLHRQAQFKKVNSHPAPLPVVSIKDALQPPALGTKPELKRSLKLLMVLVGVEVLIWVFLY